MENFKKALKIAINEQVEGIRFIENQIPTLFHDNSERVISSQPPMDSQEIRDLMSSLLPQGFDQGEAVAQGQLSIVNFGELNLIGTVRPSLSLQIFIPPQGDPLFSKVWNNLNSLTDPESDDAANHRNEEDYKPENDFLAIDSSITAGHGLQEPDTKSLVSGYHSVVRTQPQQEDPHEFIARFHNDDDQESQDSSARQSFIEGEEGSHSIHANPYLASKEDFGETSYPKIQHDRPASIGERSVHDPASQGVEHTHLNLKPLEATPSGDHQSFYGEENPFKIHFGPLIPDEIVDPHKQHKIDEVLAAMIQHNASDLHLTQSQPPAFRIDGDIKRLGSQPISEKTMESLILPIMPKKNMLEFSINSDTDFAYSIPDLARFRVNVFRDINGVGAVIRQISHRVLSIEDLALPKIINDLCALSKGLIVVTGPTGSGKSTTLAAMIDHINRHRSEHILTIEDPIELVHEQKKCLINQREIHKHTESFTRALRAALREDPDVILIGEMRDLETVAIAIETAQTGHLVFGTLHTNTAVSTVDRLIDQFPADQQEQIRVMLADSLKGVVCQTLIKKISGGRCAAHEILIVDKAVSSLIREGNTHMIQNHMQTQKAKGNILLNEALLNLVTEGQISIEDAHSKSTDKDVFISLSKQKGIKLSKVS